MTDMTIPGGLDAADAAETLGELRRWLEDLPPEAEASVEVSAPRPTQIALQLLFATVKSAEARGTPLATGPNAAGLVAAAMPRMGD